MLNFAGHLLETVASIKKSRKVHIRHFKHFEDITNLGIAASHQQATLPYIYWASTCGIDFI
ncbi:hypothetical protein ACWATR_13940 [Nostoc sp. UIC 10890]